MSFATTTVEVAFASAPLGGAYTWTDITDYVKAFNTSRGRDYELDAVQAGKVTVNLSNADGRFTPGLVSSPYYPNVIPRRRIRIRTTDPLAVGGTATPTVDAQTTATTASAITMTWSHTVSAGSNRALFVDIGFTSNTDEVGTMTYGGTPMTLVGSAVQSGSGGTDRRVERWMLLAPAVGTASILVTWFNTTSHTTTGVTTTTAAAVSTSLFGVDQTTPVGTNATANGTSATTTGSLAPTVLATDLVLSMVMARTTTAETSTGTTTSGTLLAGTNNYLGYGTASGATSWSWSVADRFAAVATPVHGAATGAGTPTTVFTGFVESWQQSFIGGGPDDSEVTLTAVDGFKVLGQTDVLTPYAAAVLSDGAFAFYPLGETADASAAVETTGTYAPAVPALLAGGGLDTATFGSFSAQAATNGTGLELVNHAGGGRTPSLLLGSGNGQNTPTIPATGSVEFWYKLPTGSGIATTGNMPLFSAHPVNTSLRDGGIDLYCPTSGSELKLYINDGTGTRTLDRVDYNFPGSKTFTDGNPHQFVITWGASNVNLYVDGALVGTSATAAAFPYGQPRIINVGGASVGPAWYTAAAPFSGVIQGVALFNTQLSLAQVAKHYATGNGGSGDDESTRMGTILDIAGWPAADRSLDAGLSSLSGLTWAEGSNALQLVQGYAADAGGYVFINPAGQFVYHNRQHRLNQASRVTFAEATSTGVEGDVQFHMDDSNIKNKVAVTTPNQSQQVASDSTSIAAFGTSADTLSLNVLSANEALDAANWRVNLYKNPLVRCDTLTIEPVTSNALWQWVLGLELGDRVTVGGMPASAPASSVNFIVEAVRHNVVAEGGTPSWITTLQLSPDIPILALVLDDNTYGILDTDCLVY